MTVFPPLYAMRQGLRASILPAINLAQISEFSLVLIQVGVQSGQTTPRHRQRGIHRLRRAGGAQHLHDDAQRPDHAAGDPHSQAARASAISITATEHEPENKAELKRRILLLGFYRVASSFLTELERRHAALLEQICVVDFNPTVYHALQARGVKVHYGDIAHVDTLSHAGVADAEIVISSVPDSLLKGTTNEKLVRHVRMVNPTAKIIATADVLSEAQMLYAAGADYVSIARLGPGQRADRSRYRGRGGPARRPEGEAGSAAS